jgi:hypothetical protein
VCQLKLKHNEFNEISLIKETAIVITKKISTKKADQEAINDLLLLRFGIFNDDKNTKKYYLEFMTKSGKISFLVDASLYQSTKINSMGILEHDKKKIYSFEYKKIATSKDVERLNW